MSRSRIPSLLSIVVLCAFFVSTASAQNPVAGPNINMVSGTDWTTGDPFLQRQNEPSVAVSARNPLHLLAGANDYRTVDLPGLLGVDERADAWLGVFKSFDGGQTWRSSVKRTPGPTSLRRNDADGVGVGRDEAIAFVTQSCYGNLELEFMARKIDAKRREEL